MRFRRLSAVVVVFALALVSSACSTIIRPTRPDVPLEPGIGVNGFRFDGDRVDIREPGVPVSGSRAWQREVANYTAEALNTLLATDDTAPAARTIVSFDQASPAPIQIGTWKEMTIELTTLLPNGQVVRTRPVTGNIDSVFEYFAVQGIAVTGSALDVVATIAALVASFGSISPLTAPYTQTACYVFIGALIGGLALNLGQTIAAYFVAQSEESRWSNLYAEALKLHAEDIREAVARGPGRVPSRAAPGGAPPGTAPPGTPGTAPPGTSPPPAGEAPPAPEVEDPSTPPPPPLLDPADDLDRQLQGGGTLY